MIEAAAASGGEGAAAGGMKPSAGAVFKFVGALVEGYAASEAHSFNADMARTNAQLVRQQALLEVGRIRRQSVKDIGSMRANYGAQGVTASGSVLDAIADSATQFELDAQLTRWQGEVAAVNFENQAKLEDAASRNAMVSGGLEAIGGLLG